MARIPKPSAPKKSAFAVHTFTLTDDVAETLRQLSSDASDFLGRSISSSAIVRALVRQVDQLGRRNLTPDQYSILRGRRYNRMKKRHGA